MFKIALLDYKKNPNIGTFIFTNNKITLVPIGMPKNEKKIIEETLSTRVIEAKIYDSETLGVFIIGNDEVLIIPEDATLIIEKEEDINYLNENFKIVKVAIDKNALSNNFALIGNTLITHKKFKKEAEIISEILNYDILTLDEEINVIGTLIKANNKGVLVSPLLSESSMKSIRDKIGEKFKVIISTVNDENEYIGSSLVVNDKGVILGNKTKGFEVINIEEAFK